MFNRRFMGALALVLCATTACGGSHKSPQTMLRSFTTSPDVQAIVLAPPAAQADGTVTVEVVALQTSSKGAGGQIAKLDQLRIVDPADSAEALAWLDVGARLEANGSRAAVGPLVLSDLWARKGVPNNWLKPIIEAAINYGRELLCSPSTREDNNQ